MFGLFDPRRKPDPKEALTRLVFWSVVYPVVWFEVWRFQPWGGAELGSAALGFAVGGALGFGSLGVLAGALFVGRILQGTGLLPPWFAGPALFWSVLYLLPGLVAGILAAGYLALIRDGDGGG